MFSRVMVGVDGQEGGHDAIALARQLVARDGVLIEAHVRESYPAKFGGPQASSWELTDDGIEEKAEIEATGTPVSVRHILATSTGRGLHELAEEEGADLLVVGSTRHGVLGRVMIGDRTSESINGAPCAIAVAPSAYAKSNCELRRVGVAYDGTVESKHALAVARKIAADQGATLAAMKVVKVPMGMYNTSVLPLHEMIKPLVEEARSEIEALGDVEPHSQYGDVAEELTQFSRNVDLLVIGSRGYGPFGRLVHSSASRHLSRSCHSPLLVLTRAAREHDAILGADAQTAASQS